MKISKFFSGVFGLIGICVCISALWLSFYAMEAAPTIIETPGSAIEQVESMMDSFCAGDYTGASGYIYGNPNLGVDREASEEIGVLIWEAFEDSMTWELTGECYATDSGLTQNIRVTTLDINAVTDYLEANARTRIEELAQNTEDYDSIFDENDEYRSEYIQQMLLETTREALETTDATITTEVTLNLVWSDGQWWVVSSEALLKAVSGGIAK